MIDAEQIRWLKSSANELNNLLQVIAESCRQIEIVSRQNPETQKYFDFLNQSVARAAKATDEMLARATNYKSPEIGVKDSPIPDTTSIATDEPAVKSQAAPRPQDENFSDIRISNPGGPRELVMIVDDDPAVLLLATQVLTNDGYQVVTANDGFTCVKMYRRLKDRVSLVIIDYNLPVMDGAELFYELRTINPLVCAMLSSGFAEQEELRKMLARGLRGFIPKPYTHQKLLLNVRVTLDGLKRGK